jgi:hypothetical protein
LATQRKNASEKAPPEAAAKTRDFLIDTYGFIFRA